jgi:hypothetical protein
MHTLLLQLFTICWLIAYGQVSSARVVERPSYELGAAILLLMPDRGTKQYFWDHRANSDVVWFDDGYQPQNSKTHEEIYARHGVLRVNVRGRVSTVLKQRKLELPWTIRYESKSHPKFGVETISLKPGFLEETCFGSVYTNCAFDVLPSLRYARITARQFCKSEGTQYKHVGYKITHPSRASALLIHMNSWGSGGNYSSIELRLGTESVLLCEP